MQDYAVAAFWLFIGMVSVGGIWGDVRKREMKQKSLENILLNQEKLDEATTEKLIELVDGNNQNMFRDLKIAGFITSGAAVGLAIMGWFLPGAETFKVMLGVGALVGCISFGLHTAARFVAKTEQ